MKPVMIRWNLEPLKWRGTPAAVLPDSPVQSWRKLSAVRGATAPYRPKTTRSAGASPMVTSKKTLCVGVVSGGTSCARADGSKASAEGCGSACRVPSHLRLQQELPGRGGRLYERDDHHALAAARVHLPQAVVSLHNCPERLVDDRRLQARRTQYAARRRNRARSVPGP